MSEVLQKTGAKWDKPARKTNSKEIACEIPEIFKQQAQFLGFLYLSLR